MRLSAVIPTITGREQLLDQTIQAFRRTVPPDDLELVVVRDRPCIGQAWQDGAPAATGDVVMLAADDVEPQPGWWDAVTEGMEISGGGVLPSPRVLNPDGTLHSCGTLGGGMLLGEVATGTPCASTPFPIFPRDAWPMVRPVPAIHYYADDFVSWMLRRAGYDIRVDRRFVVRHLEGVHGQARMVARSQQDRARHLAAYTAVSSPAGEAVAA